MTARPDDLRKAVRLGFEFGLTIPLTTEKKRINESASRTLNSPLNEIAIEFGYSLYGEVDEFDDAQLSVLTPYLGVLSKAASTGVLAAMSFREGFLEEAGMEPPANFATGWIDEAADSLVGLSEIDAIEEDAAKDGRNLSKEERAAKKRLEKTTTRGFRRALGWARTATPKPSAPIATDPKPTPRRRLSPEEAEEWCAEWLRHFGAYDAQVTRVSADGGLDIISGAKGWGVQVKNYTGSVSVMEVRQLAGVCHVEGLLPVFMTSGTYTKEALAFARAGGVTLYKYDAQMGTCHLC